jgi:uncharacterized membrane-anchored protein
MSDTTKTGLAQVSKFPIVGILFWMIKIIATTLGESASNFVTIEPLHWGYAVGAALFVVLFVISLIIQLKANRFHPAAFWSVILTTSILGTSISDFINRSLGLGYAGGAALLTTLLIAALIVWRLTGEVMNVERIDTFKGEVLYWIATLISNTLGTSSGDFLSDGLHIGFDTSAAIIVAAMIIIVACHYLTPINATVLFWAAYVLTRPLGATGENAVEKPVADGGAGVGTTLTSLILLVLLIAAIGYQYRTSRRQTQALTPTTSNHTHLNTEARPTPDSEPTRPDRSSGAPRGCDD